MLHLERYFSAYRQHIIGLDAHPEQSAHDFPILYADWTASGRLYQPIENYITEKLGPYIANTHTETTLTGIAMTQAYEEAKACIRKHVNANESDVLVFSGYGMTAAVNKFQRILGLRYGKRHDAVKPLVIISHMEHYSNHVSWVECDVDVAIIHRDTETGTPDLAHLREILEANRHRPGLIGAFTACSNATGIITPYREMAALMHEYNGLCVVDFAASAPYVDIDMHPKKQGQHLDAVFFSPHKFLGGPGASGLMVFNRELYDLAAPDEPGGGTVRVISKEGKHEFVNDISQREDGGTPGFLQAIRAALAIKLKEEMGSARILAREKELLSLLFERLDKIPGLHILERQVEHRIGIVSFYVEKLDHDQIVKALDLNYGVQTRGGLSCAGYYGHILLNDDTRAELGCMSPKKRGKGPSGWVRVSLHPTMSNEEVLFISRAIEEVVQRLSEETQPVEFERVSGYPSLFDFNPCPA